MYNKHFDKLPPTYYMAAKQSQCDSKDIFTLTAEALGMGNVMLSYIFSGRQLVNCSHFAAERLHQYEQMEI